MGVPGTTAPLSVERTEGAPTGAVCSLPHLAYVSRYYGSPGRGTEFARSRTRREPALGSAAGRLPHLEVGGAAGLSPLVGRGRHPSTHSAEGQRRSTVALRTVSLRWGAVGAAAQRPGTSPRPSARALTA